jgi:site-specific DNA recombinase
VTAPPPADDDGEPWIGYIRVSTWREEKISPELQRAAIEAWAARTGRRIIAWVTDLDMTGRNFRRRIMGAIERVVAGEARGIAVWRFSRFGRNMVGVQANLARVEAAGGQLVSATEPVDAATAVGGLQRDIHFAFAAFESNRAGEQWRETHDHRRGKLLLPATGRPRAGYIWHPRRVPDPESPTGWRLQDERYEPRLDAADIIAEAYEDKIEPSTAATFRQIAAAWNADGMRTTRGGLWDGSSVRQYMDSGFPAGLLRVHDQTCKCGKWSTCKRYGYTPGAHPSLIEPDVWEAYLKHRAQTKVTPPRARIPSYPLTGLAAHGHCRHNLQANTAWIRGEHVPGYTYRCPYAAATTRTGCPGVYINRATLEQHVRDWLAAERLSDAAGAIEADAPAADPRVHHARERARLEDELAKVTSALGRLAADRAIDPDAMPPEVYAAARRRIAERESALRAVLDRAVQAEAAPQRADYGPAIATVADLWVTATDRERNAMLRTVIRRVVVHRVERPGARASARIEVHPMWDPDPWGNNASASG